MNTKPLAKTSEILIQEFDKELLVYDLQTNKAFCLNETSAIVFQLCDGTKSFAEISDLMSRKLKTLVSEDFVLLALNELKRDELLENADELDNHFAGISRREMVRKVGLASMIALPVISSVVAPSAANAASGCPTGCSTGGLIPDACIPQTTTPNSTGCANYCNSFCCSGLNTGGIIFNSRTASCSCQNITCFF